MAEETAVDQTAIDEAAADEGAARDPMIEDDLEDLYEHAPCGYVSTTVDGHVIRINRTMLHWLGRSADEVLGQRVTGLLAGGSRVYFETHVSPMLQLQGVVREIALDVRRSDGTVFPVLLNAARRTTMSAADVIRWVVLDATERRAYEEELRLARLRAEEALAEVKQLQDLLPMCAWCRKVRDDDGYWDELEEYVQRHGGTRFTHGMCEDCYRANVPSTDG